MILSSTFNTQMALSYMCTLILKYLDLSSLDSSLGEVCA